MARPAAEGATIRYETTVSQIRHRTAESDKVEVVTSSGERLHFDEVVVTAPLGWLQRNLAAFDPPLAPSLCKAIRSIGYGCLEKARLSSIARDGCKTYQE